MPFGKKNKAFNFIKYIASIGAPIYLLWGYYIIQSKQYSEEVNILKSTEIAQPKHVEFYIEFCVESWPTFTGRPANLAMLACYTNWLLFEGRKWGEESGCHPILNVFTGEDIKHASP